MIADAAARRPHHPALICDGESRSWADFDGRVKRVANALLAAGLGHGEKVALLGRNSPEYVEVFIGTIRAGGCIVPLSSIAPSDALERMIVDSGARFFFLASETRDLVAPFVGRLDGLADGGRIALDFDQDGWVAYDGCRDAARPDNPAIAIALVDNFNIICSSGTTGVPKGILHTNGVRTQVCHRFPDLGFGPDCVTALSTPFYSNTTIVTLLPTLAHGGTVVLMRRFDVDGFLALVEAEKVIHTMLVPVQYQRIMASPRFADFDLTSMEMKLSTSAPFRAALKLDVVDRFPGRMVELYGLTESGGATFLDCTEFPDELGSVGQPGLGTEMKIIDENGKPVAPGVLGEIVSRSNNMMVGYFKAPEKTAEILWHDDDGKAYFRSGNVGRFDEDGFLWLGDRLKDVIISGGQNVFANDLELVLLDHPAVEDVAVIAVPSETWGETPLGLAVVRRDAGSGQGLGQRPSRQGAAPGRRRVLR
jgi:long-chain acyl-CoA synthetase